MADKIIFLDIDGPMIPSRAYNIDDQTRPIVMKFDPCAVALLRIFCEQRGWKIVLHSSWIKHRIHGGKQTYAHCLEQGFKPEHFHENAWCDEYEDWRYTRVSKWLAAHPDVTKYLILDDEPYEDDKFSPHKHPEDLKDHLILVDFDDGLVKSVLREMIKVDETNG